jgi:hypothetical protein
MYGLALPEVQELGNDIKRRMEQARTAKAITA